MSGNGLAYTYTKGIHAGVSVMVTMGALSAFTSFLLLLHLVHVAFIPTVSHLRYLSREQTTAEPVATRVRLNIFSSSSGGRKVAVDNPSITPVTQAQERRPTVLLQADRIARERIVQGPMSLPMQLGVFVCCLLLSDLVQALGVLIQFRWLQLGGIQTGTACRVQAALITFGDVASGVWNGTIAVHTCFTVCFGKRMTTRILFITMVCGWTIPVLMNIIGAVILQNHSTRGPYYGVAGAWCFITNAYDVERAWLHYAPMLVAAGIITLMYIPVFLTIRGNLRITPSQSDWCGYRFTFRSAPMPLITGSTLSGGSSSQSTHLRGVARKVLWYPIAYMAVLLPTVVCRFKAIYGKPVSLPVLLGCISLLSSMGLSNVCIYIFTRNLGGEPWFARSRLAKQTDMEVFVERTTRNEMGPVPRSHNGRIQDKASRIIDAMRIPPQHSDFCFGGDLYPDIESKASEVEVDGLPLTSPSPKHVLLHDLIFQHRTPPSLSSPGSEHDRIGSERVAICSHGEHGQNTPRHSLQSSHSVTTHNDPSS